MSASRYFLPKDAGAATLANDVAPNTTEPKESRLFDLARPQGAQDGVWLAATGGGPTVRLWMFDPTMKRWLAVTANIVLAADVMTVLAPGLVPMPGGSYFLQIVANGGATAAALGTTQS